jgi:hypothetical protein
VGPGVGGARIKAILELVMLSFALGPPLGHLWFLECGKLRALALVLVCESWSCWGKNSGNLGVGHALLCLGSSIGSIVVP